MWNNPNKNVFSARFGPNSRDRAPTKPTIVDLIVSVFAHSLRAKGGGTSEFLNMSMQPFIHTLQVGGTYSGPLP